MDGIAKFRNGHWVWSDHSNGVQFISHDIVVKREQTSTKAKVKTGKQAILPSSIQFKENIDNVEKIFFRRFFQRHVKLNEPDVITIQDIKDVALFLASPKDLSVEFITYFHLPEIDNFLKNVIIYFHYYLQIWEQMLSRREEARRKLRQPVVAQLEDVIRYDLSDLRSMLAREYAIVLLGIGKVYPFHHMTTSINSLSERDRRIFEALICMTVRVVWIALQRRHLALIELELNRVLRTDFFNIVLHRSNKPTKSVWRSPEEDRVLTGIANLKETKLKQRSALAKELLVGKHDCRMLGIGFRDFCPKSDRIVYLENMFAAPVEELFEYGITIGLIGVAREEYDCMMYPRERTSKNFDKVLIEPINFDLPDFEDIPDKDMPKEFPKAVCKYKESIYTIRARREQCRLWRNHVFRHEKAHSSTSSKTNVF